MKKKIRGLPLAKLHRKEEKLHHKAEKAMKEDEKVHKKIEKKEHKEDRKKPARKYSKKAEKKIKKVMHEYGKGELHSGSKKGPVVKNVKQAQAIAISEAKRKGLKVPKKKKSK